MSGRWSGASPFCGEPTGGHLCGEIKEDGDGEIFSRKTLFEEFQTGNRIVHLEPDLAHQMNKKERLDVFRESSVGETRSL